MAATDRLRRWTRQGTTAPHKPLLILFALGWTRDGAPRLRSFTDIEAPLRELLRSFSTSSRQHPEYPFWRLQADGFWEVHASGPLLPRASNSDPPVRELRAKQARGGLIAPLDRELRQQPEMLQHFAEHVAHGQLGDCAQSALDATGFSP